MTPQKSHFIGEPPAKRIRTLESSIPRLSGPMVTILVGGASGQPETFMAHESLLRKNSVFFDNTLTQTSKWKEASARTVGLPSHQPNDSNIYLQWLYSRSLCTKIEDDCKEADQNGIKLPFELSRLERCFTLGQYLQDVEFMDVCVDARLERAECEDQVDLALSWSLYRTTGKNSPQRKLGLDYFLHRVVAQGHINVVLEKCKEQHDFMYDVALRAAGDRAAGRNFTKPDKYPWQRDPCQYHEHTRHGKPCYRTKYGFI